MKREHIRPLVHAGALGFVFLEPMLGRWGMAGTAFVAFLLNAFLLPRTAVGKMLRRPGDPWFNGQLSYPLALAIAYAVFDPVVACIAWTVMALGDPAAFVVGTSRERRVRIPWNRRKSLAGSMAFLVVAWAGSLAALCTRVYWGRGMGELAEFLAFGALAGIAAVVGTIVESLPLPIDDNLPVVLAVGGAMALIFHFLSGLC